MYEKRNTDWNISQYLSQNFYRERKKEKNMKNKNYLAHFSALLTIIIWGTTFISTKILLTNFKPIEILVFRFILGFIALLLICPKRMKVTDRKHEVTFMCAGLCGICMYYLLENIALTYTLASNVGVIISVVPFFTAILAYIFIKKEEQLSTHFFLGFIVAIIGITLISFNGSKMQLNPLGDLLALLASFVWALYSVLTRKISSFGYPVILATRRTFLWGILFMLPIVFTFDFNWNWNRFANTTNLLNMAYLGFGASALCFVTWNFSVKKLGAVKTSVYIYMVPVITVITSVFILKERITILSALGIIFTLIGLGVSEMKIEKKRKNKQINR